MGTASRFRRAVMAAAGLVAAFALLADARKPGRRLRTLLDGLVMGGSLLFVSRATALGAAYRPGVAVAGFLLLGVAAYAPAAAKARDSRLLVAVPYLPLLLASAVSLWVGVMHGGLDTTGTVAVSVLVALVVVRQVLGLAENARLAEAAQAREEHFRTLVQGSSDVVAICDPDGTLRFVSPAMTRVFGHDVTPLLGTRLTDLVHPADAARVVAEVTAALAGSGPAAPALIECRIRVAAGGWRFVEAVVSDQLHSPSVGGIVLNIRDVTERTELERQLAHQSFHDPLTGMANRSLFRDRVHHALALRSRTHQPLAVLFLDLDAFKAINDSLGHSVGDQLLAAVAARLQSVVRPGDTVARLGGDEFAVLFEDLEGLHVAQALAGRFLDELKAAFTIDGHEVFVDASIGLAVAGNDSDADELLRNADLAMYRAKALGKGRCEVFEPDMHAAVLERLEIERDLRHAVVRGELRLHYQPILDLATGRVVGVEALLRWQHPTRGLVSPLDFIHTAEETGLIVPVGRWVLEEACRQVTRWQRDLGETLRLSVNISNRQLQAPRLAEHVAKTLRASGLRPADLTLEITESMLVDDTDRTIAKLHLLRELGVRLAIDDFGTGYSSLQYLRRLPVDILKIDRSFVKGIGHEDELTSLTGAIVGIGRNLGLDTVAEGIEETGQLDGLRDMGCQYGQGYLFARPLTPEQLAEVLHDGQLVPAARAATA